MVFSIAILLSIETGGLSGDQALNDLGGQQDEDQNDRGFEDLRAVFDGQSGAEEAPEEAQPELPPVTSPFDGLEGVELSGADEDDTL